MQNGVDATANLSYNEKFYYHYKENEGGHNDMLLLHEEWVVDNGVGHAPT